MPLETPARLRTPLAPELSLPPPFAAVRLRESGDAFAHAKSIAAEQGAGTLVYVGLDADATRIGDLLWNEADIDETAMAGVIGLFAITFRDPSIVLDKVKGEPVYLILAMTPNKTIRMKPQNLATGLPIRHLEAVS